MSRLWGGRFSDGPADELLAFTESVSFDHVLAIDDCAVLTAHAGALARAGILTADEAGAIADALAAIGPAIARGDIAPEPGDEDIHAVVERALLARAPEAGAKARAGLSRNDRVVTALRRWLVREGTTITARLLDLIEVLVERAVTSRDVLVPGYTHLQRAQPVTLGHHLLAHAFALERDARRLIDALGRTDASALGAGALAGSTLPLSPQESARALGLSGTMHNSLDAVAARDFVAEFLAAAAILGVHLSRIGEEIVLWTSAEFGFARLDDAYATGSSLMPQKRNPDIAELARGKAGRLIGNLTGSLAALKGLPLAYNRDLQEDKEPLFDSVRTLGSMLPAVTGMMRTIVFRPDPMAAAATADTLATDLAEALVRGGLAFRAAHEAVGALAAAAEAAGKQLTDLTPGEVHAATDAVDPAALAVLSAAASIDAREAPGPGKDAIDAQLEVIRASLADLRAAAPGDA